MSQFELKIIYVRGEDNTVADALSRLPDDDSPIHDEQDEDMPNYVAWNLPQPVAAISSISADAQLLRDIKSGYAGDAFCQRIKQNSASFPTLRDINGLLYLGDRLLIPNVPSVREALFRTAHDVLGHFGTAKSYAALRESFFWLGMRKDLAKAYVPGCVQCQKNKSPTSLPAGPLHPLPIPDARGDSIAMDFIGPLPEDSGFNAILTVTDRLAHADIRIIPTRMDVSAADTALLLYDNWYLENGLPLDIVSDRDPRFVADLWKTFCRLTRIKQKMSSAHHPQTDGASEVSNKTVIQCIRFHVERHQRGWVKALPTIRFEMMNTINSSTGLSGFQVRMGRSPRVLPPLVPSLPEISALRRDVASALKTTMSTIADCESQAKDVLLIARVSQAHFANIHRNPEREYRVGDRVLLSTTHRRKEYKDGDKSRVAKFVCRFDGPYSVTSAFPETSTYALDLPNSPRTFNTFHTSQLRPFVPNDDVLFPGRKVTLQNPIYNEFGEAEFVLDRIIAERRIGRGYQYLVTWVGEGDEENRWLPRRELEDCEVLDKWLLAKKSLLAEGG
jgi:hypothetical protein